MTKCICGVKISPDNVKDHQGCGTKMYNGERRDMTPEQEMQAIVEAAGDMWFGPARKEWQSNNPSPTDLNAISEYERKLLTEGSVVKRRKSGDYYARVVSNSDVMRGTTTAEIADTEVDARRSALYVAIKEV